MLASILPLFGRKSAVSRVRDLFFRWSEVSGSSHGMCGAPGSGTGDELPGVVDAGPLADGVGDQPRDVQVLPDVGAAVAVLLGLGRGVGADR
ncbi:hypothetical protein SGLAM104S_00069 [Streptomyces glaucescens]